MAVKTGLITDERGTNSPLPAWPYPASANGSVSKFASHVSQLLEHGSYYDAQNLKVFHASKAQLARGTDALGTAPSLPNNDSRRAEANRRLAKTRAAKKAITDDIGKLLHERDLLKPFDPNPNPLHAEMRSMARAMSPEQRNQLMKDDPDFREAVLSAKPWLSGMEASLHSELYKQALETRYGPRLKELDEGIDAGSRALEVHATVERAIGNELVTVGEAAPVIPPEDKVSRVELFVPKI
jgi:hypothetical protein